jgi:hypothetical protein
MENRLKPMRTQELQANVLMHVYSESFCASASSIAASCNSQDGDYR